MNEQLAQAYVGTRIGHSTPDGFHGIQRINVLTFIDKFTRGQPNRDELLKGYDWLSDAAHPSYGSHSAYQAGVYPEVGEPSRSGTRHRHESPTDTQNRVRDREA
jgi:hypothetical protein